MKRPFSILISVCFIFLLASSTAFAVGFGAFIDVSGGSGEAEWASDYDSWDIDSSSFSGGFVFDTSPTNRSPFNYRLNVGVSSQKLQDDAGIDLKSTGIYIENIFGFAIVKNENFRWWIGPLVRVGYYSGKTDTIQYGYYSFKTEVDYAEFGIGAVTGINFKAGNVIISPSVGLRFTGFYGNGDTKYRDIYGTHSDEDDIDGYTTTAFANLAVLIDL